MKQQDALVIRKIGNYYDGGSAAGWHAMRKDVDGNWESLSGPHFSWLMAKIEGQKKTPK